MRLPVAILGAGFAGLATAHALARRGVEAIVLEREPALGRFASGRGAGLGRQLCEDDATTRLAMRGAARLRADFAHAWQPTGGILSFEDAALANEYIARARRVELAHDVIDRTRLGEMWPQLAALPIATAIHIPSDGVIDTNALLAAYASGANIELATRATRIDPPTSNTNGFVRVYVDHATRATDIDRATRTTDIDRATRTTDIAAATDRSPIDARVVVDATGAWAGSLTGDAALDAYKRHLFVVEATATAWAPYLWHLGARELYLRADGNNVLVSPCDGDATAAADQQPSDDADARLRARLVDAPALAKNILKRWACQRAFAPDRLMRLGRDPQRPWLVWAAALGGHGATASPAVGEIVADAVIAALS